VRSGLSEQLGDRTFIENKRAFLVSKHFKAIDGKAIMGGELAKIGAYNGISASSRILDEGFGDQGQASGHPPKRTVLADSLSSHQLRNLGRRT